MCFNSTKVTNESATLIGPLELGHFNLSSSVMDHEREPGTARFGNFINYYSFNPAERRIKLLPSQSSDILDCVCSRRSMSATPGQEAVKENKVVMLDIGSNAGVSMGSTLLLILL